MHTSAPTPTAIFLIALPELAYGEQYAGIVIDDEGHPTHHLILLPQQPETRLTWDAAMKWAKGIGGDLPTNQEHALLYANLQHAFDDSSWHWSSEQYADIASEAWVKHFVNGYQGVTSKSRQATACAVRRLPID